MTFDPHYHSDTFNQLAFTRILQLVESELPSPISHHLPRLLERMSIFYPGCNIFQLTINVNEDMRDEDVNEIFAKGVVKSQELEGSIHYLAMLHADKIEQREWEVACIRLHPLDGDALTLPPITKILKYHHLRTGLSLKPEGLPKEMININSFHYRKLSHAKRALYYPLILTVCWQSACIFIASCVRLNSHIQLSDVPCLQGRALELILMDFFPNSCCYNEEITSETCNFGDYLIGGGMALSVLGMIKKSSLIRVLRMSPKITSITRHAQTLLSEYMNGNIWKIPCMTAYELEGHSCTILTPFYLKCVTAIQMLWGINDESSVIMYSGTSVDLFQSEFFEAFKERMQEKSAKAGERYESPVMRSRVQEHEMQSFSHVLPPKARVITDTELLMKHRRGIAQVIEIGNGNYYNEGDPVVVFDDGSMYRAEESFGYLLVAEQNQRPKRWAVAYAGKSIR